jgi:hypothetical protein
MPNWNKIIVGNAFKLPSRAPRFYLDLVLWFPTFFTGIWFGECFHGWRVNQWDVKGAALSATVLCVLLLLIKERTIVIASMLGVAAHSARLYYFFHGDVQALKDSLLFYGGAVVVVIIGLSFRFKFMKNPDFDPTYRKLDRENTWLGVVLVLGLLFGIGFVGIYLAWR